MSYDYNASSYPVQSASWDSSSQAGSVYSPTGYNQMWPATPTGHVALANPNASLYSPYNTATYAPGYIYAYPNSQYSAASGYYGTQSAYGQTEATKQKPSKDTGSKTLPSPAGVPAPSSYSSNSHHPVSYGAYGGQAQSSTQLHDYDSLLNYYGYCKPNSSSQGGGGYRGQSPYAAKSKGKGAANQSTTGSVDSNLTQQFAGKCKLASPDAKARTAEVSSSWSSPYGGTGDKGNSQADAYAAQSTASDYTMSTSNYYGGKGDTANPWPSGEPKSVASQNMYDSSGGRGGFGHSTPDTPSSYNSLITKGSYGSSAVQEGPSSYNSSSSYGHSTMQAPSSFSSPQGGYGNSTPGTPSKAQSHSTQQSADSYTSSGTQSNYAHSKQQATAYGAQSSFSHSSQQSTGSYNPAVAPSYTQQNAGSYNSANSPSSYARSTSTNSGFEHSNQQAPGSYNSIINRNNEKTADSDNANNNDSATASWDKSPAVGRNESYSTAHDGGKQPYGLSKQPTTDGGSAPSETSCHANKSETLSKDDSKTQPGADEDQKQDCGEDKGDSSAEGVNTSEGEAAVAYDAEYADVGEETVPVYSDAMIPMMEDEPRTREEREYMFPVSSGLYHKATGDRRPGRPFNREEDLGNGYNDGANFYTMGYTPGYGQLHWNSGPQAWARKDQFSKAAPITGGFGMKMLTRMGWKPGEGLGKERNGGYEPLAIKVKIDRKGLTAEEELTAKGKIKRPVPELNIKIDPKKTKNVPVAAKVLSGEEEAKLREMVSHRHPCMALNELCGKKQWPLPTFKVMFKNSVCFATVLVNGTSYEASHPNKKLAKAEVARVALQHLGYSPIELQCCFNKKTFL